MTDHRPADDDARAETPVLGILGGGQLGRMLAVAASRLGIRTAVYSAADENPAFDVATRAVQGAYDDRAQLMAFARQVDVITYEFENVAVAGVEALADIVAVRPGVAALRASQDRLAEKQFISRLGIATAPFRPIETIADLEDACAALSGDGILKTRTLGYDGKGQARLRSGDDWVAAAARCLESGPCILEGIVPFERELSVIAVRGLNGEFRAYDSPMNVHADGILRRSTVPADIEPHVSAEARTIARTIAEALDYCGVLTVELFDLGACRADRLVVNEIAPRVHNSGHWTMDACVVDQFENHVRAVMGLPLGSTRRTSDVVMDNLIGDDILRVPALLAEPDTAVHLYGKARARPGRKMGHVNRLGGA